MPAGLLQREIVDNMESCRGERCVRPLGKVSTFWRETGKRKFLLSPTHVEVIPLLAPANMDNH